MLSLRTQKWRPLVGLVGCMISTAAQREHDISVDTENEINHEGMMCLSKSSSPDFVEVLTPSCSRCFRIVSLIFRMASTFRSCHGVFTKLRVELVINFKTPDPDSLGPRYVSSPNPSTIRVFISNMASKEQEHLSQGKPCSLSPLSSKPCRVEIKSKSFVSIALTRWSFEICT